MQLKKSISSFLTVFFASCATHGTAPNTVPSTMPTNIQAIQIEVTPVPAIGRNDKGTEIALGGLSGLHFLGTDKQTDELLFLSHTDRGPNLEPLSKLSNHKRYSLRPFVLPGFQPALVIIRVNTSRRTAHIAQTLPIFSNDGHALSGLPNRPGPDAEAGFDEIPVDTSGKELPPDSRGLDLESVFKDADGNIWMGEEYRPSILKLHQEPAKATIVSRFVPDVKGYEAYGLRRLPKSYSHRIPNRGFEGIAGDGDSIFAFMQSPMEHCHNHINSRIMRVLEFDRKTEMTLGEYFYLLDNEQVDKVGDAVSVGQRKFWIIEQNSNIGSSGVHQIMELDLSGPRSQPSQEFPECQKTPNVVLSPKHKIIDLKDAGITDYEKIEGLARIDKNHFAIINDNDFLPQHKTVISIFGVISEYFSQ